MAEGLLNHYGKGNYTAYSAGSKPEKTVNTHAVKVMRELGIDISKNKPKHVDYFKDSYFDYVITVCGNDDKTCPVFLGRFGISLHRPFPDPALYRGTEDEITMFYRNIRDSIKKMIFEYFKMNGV